MKNKRLAFITLIFGLFMPVAFSLAGTVLSDYKFAWSNNVGYINFENVIVSDTTVTGYAWSTNTGWIKFNPAQGGVLNDGNGHLSGFAWGEGLGWIDFSGVSISTSTGKFSGTATGTVVGILNFNCPNYCDVRTDWRPPVITETCNAWTYSSWSTCSNGQQTRTVVTSSPENCTGGSPILSQGCTVSSGGGGGFGGFYAPPVGNLTFLPTHIQAVNKPLVVEVNQSGTYNQDTDSGRVVIDVPQNTFPNKTTLTISEEPIVKTNQNLVSVEAELVNGEFYNVIARNTNGDLIHYFSSPITITLPIPINLLDDTNLAVYWLNEVNQEWVLIPDAIFANKKVTFQVSHLTKFAIFSLEKETVSGVSIKTPIKAILPLASKVYSSTNPKSTISTSTNSLETNQLPRSKLTGYEEFQCQKNISLW